MKQQPATASAQPPLREKAYNLSLYLADEGGGSGGKNATCTHARSQTPAQSSPLVARLSDGRLASCDYMPDDGANCNLLVEKR